MITYYWNVNIKQSSYKPRWPCSTEAGGKRCPRDRPACLGHMSQTVQYWDAHPSPTTHQCDPFTDGNHRDHGKNGNNAVYLLLLDR